MDDKDQILEIFFKEYDKLKSEQAQRIGFRDNLLYVTLGLFATIISFAVSTSKVKEHTGYTDLETLFGWEFTHCDDKHCKR